MRQPCRPNALNPGSGLQGIRVAVNQRSPPLVGIPLSAKASSVIQGLEKNFLHKSLGSKFAKLDSKYEEKSRDQRFCAANLTRRIVWLGWGVFNGCFETLHTAFQVTRIKVDCSR